MHTDGPLHGVLGPFRDVLFGWIANAYLLYQHAVFWRWQRLSECRWGHGVSDMHIDGRLRGLLGPFRDVLFGWIADAHLLSHQRGFWRWYCLSERGWRPGIPELHSNCQLHRLLGSLLGVLFWRFANIQIHSYTVGVWGWQRLSKCRWGHEVSDMHTNGNCQLSRYLGQLWGVLLCEWELLEDSGLQCHNAAQWGWCCMSIHKCRNTVAELHTGSGLPRHLGKLRGVRYRRYANSYLHNHEASRCSWCRLSER